MYDRRYWDLGLDYRYRLNLATQTRKIIRGFKEALRLAPQSAGMQSTHSNPVLASESQSDFLILASPLCQKNHYDLSCRSAICIACYQQRQLYILGSIMQLVYRCPLSERYLVQRVIQHYPSHRSRLFYQAEPSIRLLTNDNGNRLHIMLGDLSDNAIRYTPQSDRIDLSVTHDTTEKKSGRCCCPLLISVIPPDLSKI